MLNHLHCISNIIKFQPELSMLYKILLPLYQLYVPLSFRHRRNVSQSKIDDVFLLSLLCFQVYLRITSQSRFYRYLVQNLFRHHELPEPSRFNRISRNAITIMQWIRLGLLKDSDAQNKPVYTIIDSLPLPLWLPIRNTRARVLKDYADISYNSTKKQYYYGMKGSFEISDEGKILAYTLDRASMHDIHAIKTLIKGYRCEYILADQGYLSEDLKKELKKQGITLWTPVRKNMRQPKEDTKELKKKRRYIETVFSELVNLFDIERIRVHSISGFISRLEQCILFYSLQKHLEIN